MKKILLAPLFVIAPALSAAPYVGLQYGVASVNHDFSTTFKSDAVTLTPDSSSSFIGGFVGYRADNLGLELSYKKLSGDDSHNQQLSTTEENEWDATYDASQISLKPVLFMPLTEQLTLKTGLGVSYTQYDYSAAGTYEKEIPGDDNDIETPLAGGDHSSESAFGATASIGLDYALQQHLNLGLAAEYTVDSVASNSAIMVSASYQF